MGNSVIINAENIIKSFKTEKNLKLEVLRSVSIEVEFRKISVIVGASGAGKSTLLHILGGLDRPDSGQVYFKDQDIFKLSDDRLAKFRNKEIGFVFQFHHLLPEFTALENVIIPQLISGRKMDEASLYALKILEEVGLKDRSGHKPAALSGGEQQRVAVARALANNPSLILADEPTGNLDSANSDAIHHLFTELCKKLQKTFLIVTHNAGLVQLADKVFEMRDGQIKKSV